MRNLFNSIEHLEPKCSNCHIVLHYGENTNFNEKSQSMECGGCHTPID
ncbi:hypothetical protein HOD20_05750 [archaeon]|nr:hypothetical protein [archaeon]MBT4352008.1 hypothetical protein [archaeon]MBT4646911.1 hypothetical protein [archaeon]MBT6820891.1 hypothetical protein [archaeon]MBT7391201.1 hypothetical protein [archaeon]